MISLSSRWAQLRPGPMAPVLGIAQFGPCVLALMAGVLWAFVDGSTPKPLARWNWMDIVGEGSMTLMSGIWLLQLRASRPGGRVTSLLCLGMACLLLGQWTDFLDEFWALPKSVLWDNWLESGLMPLGCVVLTLGLHHWRLEQQVLTEQLLKRERLFREHRSLDGITQLGDAGYMAAQIRIEQQMQGSLGPAALLMLGLRGFDSVAREHGLAEADRLLQAASHLLLLNLRPNDLLCRYAADRFCVLMPGVQAAQAAAQAEHLQQAMSSLAHHTRQGLRLQTPGTACWAMVNAQDDAQAQLLTLARRLSERT